MRNAGAWWYYEDEQGQLITIDGIPGKFKSKAAFLEVLRTNEAWYNEMLNKLNGGLSSDQDDTEMQEIEQENTEINDLMDEVLRTEEAADIANVLDSNE